MFRHFSLPVMIPLFVALLVVVVLMAITRVPISYNVRNLVARWKTTLLTAVAFALVVGLLTAMIAAQVHRLHLLEGGQWFRGVRELPGGDPKLAEARNAAQVVGMLASPTLQVPVFATTANETAIEAVLGEGVARELGRPLGKES